MSATDRPESEAQELALKMGLFPDLRNSVTRRSFIKILGASIALAGLDGCTFFGPEEIVPYVDQPENIIPGKPLYYASNFVLGGFAYGTLIETHLARPTKIEGNPDHPASLGGTDPFMQAYLLELYNPDRGRTVAYKGLPGTWDQFGLWMAEQQPRWKTDGGKGLRILTETITSPTMGHELNDVLKRYPEARWYQYEPVNRDNILAGTKLAFGKPLNPCYRMDRPDVIVSLDCDFLSEEPGHVRYARHFADRRRVREGSPGMNRLYVAETMSTTTGAMADHHLGTRPSRIFMLALALAKRLEVPLLKAHQFNEEQLRPDEKAWVQGTAQDLRKNLGKGLIVAGFRQPPELHALVYLLNEHLRNFGQSIYFTQPPEHRPELQGESIAELMKEMEEGQVDTLMVLGGNPAYATPFADQFRELLKKVPHRAVLGYRQNETSLLCDWFLPESTPFESWGDARAFDGTVSTIQPVIHPLFPTKSALQFVAMFNEKPGATGLSLVKGYWRRQWDRTHSHSSSSGDSGFEAFWKTTLHDGFAKNSAFSSVNVSVAPERINTALERIKPDSDYPAIELVIIPDPRIWDGRFSDNAWLQELPKPMSLVTWDNGAMMSPKTGKKLHLATGDKIRIESNGRTIEAPVLVLPGHADDAITLSLGYGRPHAGDVGRGLGFDAYPLLGQKNPWLPGKATVRKSGGGYEFAFRQLYISMDETKVVRRGTRDQFLKDPKKIVPPPKKFHPSLLPEYKYQKDAWAMVIDLNVCIGCKTCTIACQAENNIPVVGRDQVRQGREMHWIRVDRYYHGDFDNPEIYFQPVPCMQCEKAPCEIVCPTEATLHTPDGLNAMIYNRCVGTRFCSNNCPYKVRRFNFLQYSDQSDPLVELMYNPDVTVRSRGVMEKCTYCIQRINAVKIKAQNEYRDIRDGEIVPACAQACPTQAIFFGDKSKEDSQVTKLRKEPLNYKLLDELDTQPRTTYLARLRNPNPDFPKDTESQT